METTEKRRSQAETISVFSEIIGLSIKERGIVVNALSVDEDLALASQAKFLALKRSVMGFKEAFSSLVWAHYGSLLMHFADIDIYSGLTPKLRKHRATDNLIDCLKLTDDQYNSGLRMWMKDQICNDRYDLAYELKRLALPEEFGDEDNERMGNWLFASASSTSSNDVIKKLKYYQTVAEVEDAFVTLVVMTYLSSRLDLFANTYKEKWLVSGDWDVVHSYALSVALDILETIEMYDIPFFGDIVSDFTLKEKDVYWLIRAIKRENPAMDFARVDKKLAENHVLSMIQLGDKLTNEMKMRVRGVIRRRKLNIVELFSKNDVYISITLGAYLAFPYE